jgi:hypothetical protein
MQTCYVALPAGTRADPSGRFLDFDHLYTQVLQPTIHDLGFECHRLEEEVSPGTSWHRTLFTAILSSDLMIADVSTHNPNVLYELGVRHALKRGRTLIISATGRLPSNIGYTQALWYTPDADGRLTGPSAEEFRAMLQRTIKLSQRSTISDSPVYQYFPDIEVWLPAELETARRNRRPGRTLPPGLGLAQQVVESPEKVFREVKRSEEAIRREPATDPMEYLTLLRRYRDLSAWDEVIRLAADAPMSVADSPEVRQTLALALNRRGQPGDQDRAISLMQTLIGETGGDSESYGILGRIYKDRYDEAQARGDTVEATANLDRAVQVYRAGFEKNPMDYYPGINVIMLLLQRDDEAARTEIAALLPHVRAVVQEQIDTGRPGFWELAVQMQLAAIAGDWPTAERAAHDALAQAPASWMVRSAVRELGAIEEKTHDAAAQMHLSKLADLLSAPVDRAEADDD